MVAIEKEKPEGGWLTMHCAQDHYVHTVPNFGPVHYASEWCWCHPSHSHEVGGVLVHNVAH